MGAKAGPQVTQPKRSPGGQPGKHKVTAKVRAFIEAYKGPAKLNLTEAARLAGFKSPRSMAAKMKARHPQLVAEAEREYLQALKISAEEAEQIVAQIARDPTHRDRLKAAETFLKMHGRLSDKLQVIVDRVELNKQLDELISTMAAARAKERDDLLNPLHEPHNNPQQAEQKPS